MKLRLWVALPLLLLAATTFSQEDNAPLFGKGLFNLKGKDDSWSMKIGFRMQFLASNSWLEQDNDEGFLLEPNTNFLIRRSRLKFDGFAFSPKLQYKFELGLSNRDMSGTSVFTGNTPRFIMDAVVKWNFYENFVLWVGQTKLPGNVERVVSSGNMQLVDRSLLNARFNIDRDIGFQLRHHLELTDTFIIREIFAFSQGEGRNVTTGNLGGHQYTGRIEILPFGYFKNKGDYFQSDLEREEKPKLMLSASYDYNDNAVRARSNQGVYMITDDGFHETPIKTIFVDAMFKYRGFSLMTEYASRSADDPIARNSDGTPTGIVVQEGNAFNMQSGYLFKNNWEVAGRFTHVVLNENLTGTGPQSQYTLGFSKYFVGHKLKVQTDVNYLDLDDDTGVVLWRLQMDLHF
jgi:hypothetical protein